MMRFKRKPVNTDEIDTRNVAKPATKEKLGTNSSKLGAQPRGKDDWQATAGQTGMQNTSVGQMPIEVDVDPLLKDIVFSEDLEQKKLINRLYRDIYYNDCVCGSAVDMLSTLPFSDFTLGGISDKKAMRSFQETLERLNVRTMLPHLSTDHLVDGAFIGSLLFNRTSKRFFDIMPHRNDNCKIDSLPFYGQDPIITAAIPDDVRATLSGDGPRVQKLRDRLGDDIVGLLQQEALELDPMTTVYVPRKTFTTGEGVSFFRRVLPIYLLEKNLFRGTLVESARRQRGILHIQLGDGDQWEPTVADMEFMTELFMNADADPLGAIIATRLGVETQEIRQGGDFWKVTDTWDGTATFKLRALGISESFLSGEANYACLVGNSLIPTDKGLLRIDQLVDKKRLPTDTSESLKDIEVALDTTVQSRYANEKTSSWKYSGYTDTLKVTTAKGNALSSTPNHPYLVFNGVGTTEWKQAETLTLQDRLCVPTAGLVRTDRLQIELTDQESLVKAKGVRKQLKQPVEMTPKLAYLLGLLVSEGNLIGDKKAAITNSDKKLLSRTSKLYKDIFGVKSTLRKRISKGDTYNIQGKEGVANTDCYVLEVGSKTLVHWLRELGFIYTRKGSELPSYNQEIPWSVLQADEKSQLSFLAAYMEGDAHVSDRIAFSSASQTLMEQIQVMLLAHGVLSHRRKSFVDLSFSDSRRLFVKLERYLCTKKLDMRKDRGFKARQDFGFPNCFLKDFLEARKVGPAGGGVAYRDDLGQVIVLRNCREHMHSLGGKNFMYDKYDGGGYDGLLERLEQISPSMYRRIMDLVALRYMVVPIKSIEDGGKQHVYDISMLPGVEPAFVANGLVVHNTADTSLTVFIESIRAYRDMLTRKLFYNKIFPLVSLVNGYTVNERGKLIRKDGLLDSKNMQANLDKMADGSRLLIPNVHWAKQLKPEGDTQYLDMLQQLTERGIPVPLRAIAAAGGFNLDSLLSDGDDDLELLKRVSEYNKNVGDIKKKYGPKTEGEDGGGMGGFASGGNADIRDMLNKGRGGSVLAQQNGKRPSLKQRDFGGGEEIIGRTKTGKKKYIHNQRRAQEDANREIAAALTNVTQNKKTPLTHGSVTPQKSGKGGRTF